MKKALDITIAVLAITVIALGALASANKRRTALYGLQLPNRVTSMPGIPATTSWSATCATICGA
jgi:hypothetical protein